MTKPTNVVAEQTDWRVDQRESRRGYQHHETVKKWASILDFIVLYQNRYGFAPMNHLIAKETNLSIGQVQYHLSKMHEQCLIHDHGNMHPRIIDMLAGGKLLAGQSDKEEEQAPEEETVREMVATTNEGVVTPKEEKQMQDGTRVNKSLGYRMKQIAKIIDDYTNSYGEPPNAQSITNRMDDMNTSTGTVRIIHKMVALGYIDRKKGQKSNWLTSLGRSKLLGKDDNTLLRVKPTPDKGEDAPDSEPEKAVESVRADEAIRISHEDYRLSARTTRPAANASLATTSTLDLIVELNRRGYRIDL